MGPQRSLAITIGCTGCSVDTLTEANRLDDPTCRPRNRSKKGGDTMTEHVEITESARKVRTALRTAFPKAKISVKSRGDIEIQWEDTGPTAVELQAALKTAGLTETEQRWNGTEWVTVDNHHLWFSCFNRAQREAAQRDFEQRQQKWAAERERERAAVAEAYKAKRSARPAISLQRAEAPDPAVYEAFERLREKAEAQVVAHEGDRRPSWAPPLILGEELAMACLELGYLTMDDKWIGRLWAQFASPKRSARYVRENVSTLPLHGLSCRGFQLFAGGERQSVSAMLFEAQRRQDGNWQFGPYFYPHEYTSRQARKWEDLIRERTRLSDTLEHGNASGQEKARLVEVTAAIAAIDVDDAAASEQHDERQRLKQRTLELARARVLDFVGAPDAQMQAAGRLWGHCCRCGKALTDPLSLERGIGPDCYQHILLGIRELAANGRRVETISWLIGMPVEFVNTVLSEAA